jgi:hypothetical protein
MARESAKERDRETVGIGVGKVKPHLPEGSLDACD